MATFQEAKVTRATQAKAVVSRAKSRAPPPGPLILAAALSLACFLVSDYLLYDDTPCDGIGISPRTYLQTHRQCSDSSRSRSSKPHLFHLSTVWISENGWPFFTLSRLLLSALIFVVFCVGFACLLVLCGFK